MDQLIARNCNRDEFLHLYCKLLQERVPDTRAEVTPQGAVRMVHASGRELMASIDNVWLNYSRYKANRRELLERYVHAATAHILTEDDSALEPERIVPTIRSAQFLSQYDPENQVLREPLCGDLWVVYAEEVNGEIGVITREGSQRAGLDPAQIRNHAINNLKRVLPRIQRQDLGASHGLMVAGDHTAGLLLLDNVWDELAQSLKGNPVVAAPARDVVLYADSHSPDAIAEMKTRTESILKAGRYLISGTMITRREGRWEVFNAN